LHPDLSVESLAGFKKKKKAPSKPASKVLLF
jgi:hypothetical protein